MAFDWSWHPYVSAAEKRLRAAREIEKRKQQGHAVSPVLIEGRGIVNTFWGKAWCDNLTRYSDFANRLPRGRTYVRNGSVVDLQIAAGTVEALVSGSDLYQVKIDVTPLAKARWKSICTECAGGIDSVVELLQGRFSKPVMERICRENEGLFPAPAEIRVGCSCPDSARMCKHVAAVLYGIGARFDHQPELLFLLRKVDEKDLLANAGTGAGLTARAPKSRRILVDHDLSAIFGLDMAVDPVPQIARPARRKAAPKKTAKRTKQPGVSG